MSEEWGKDLPRCEARGCQNLADWAFIDKGDEARCMYLCAFHGGTEPVEGWQWIGE